MNWFKITGASSWSATNITLACSLTTRMVFACKMQYGPTWATSTENETDRQIAQNLNIYLQNNSTVKVGARYTSIVGVIGY